MIPRAYLTIAGVAVHPADIISATWENTLYLAADSLELELVNRELLSDWIRKNQELKFYLGYVKGAESWAYSELDYVFGGCIDAVRPRFREEDTVSLSSRDFSAPLLDTAYSVAYAERTAHQIAGIIAEKHGFAIEAVPTSDILDKEIFHDCKEWEMLQELANREGYIAYIKKEKKLVFGPRKEGEEIVARLVRGKNVVGADFDDSSVGVYNKVTVRHWAKKQIFEGSAQDDSLIKEMGRVKERIIYDAQVKSNDQAREKAEKRLREVARPVITGELTVVGNPRLVAEKRVLIEGYGRFSGTYYIEKATHRFNTSGYICDLSVTNMRPEDAQQYRNDLYDYREKIM